MKKLNLKLSNSLFKEAKKTHPGGVLGIRRPYNFVEGEYPIYISEGKGVRVIDVDGNEYIDMLCSYGPIIIGHREEKIDKKVIEQIKKKGFCFSLTQPIHNKISSILKKIIPCCDMSILVKTGSDATTAAIRAARCFTKRNKILRCGYHGWHDWCVEVKGGIPKSTLDEIIEFNYNDIESIERIIKKHNGEIAGIITTPINHQLGKKVEMPRNNFLQELRSLTKKYGIVLIFDEVRTGFRVDLGGAQKYFNVTPDLATFGKAMANGYEIAALVGNKDIMSIYTQEAFISATYFENSLPIIAALETINFIKKNKVLEDIRKKGNFFEKLVKESIKDYSDICEFSGGPWMPYITFKKDNENKYKIRRKNFYTNLIKRKVFSQPFHHSYIAYRHSYKDLKYVAGAIEESLKDIV